MEQNFNENPHPCVGVMYPAFHYPLPKDGHIGYVRFENPNDYVGETEPRWFDVDEYEYEAIG